MKHHERLVIWPKMVGLYTLVLLSTIVINLVYGAQWSDTSISFLRGNNYEMGAKSRSIITIEHADVWQYGDNFIFFDITHFDQEETAIYGEWSPRLSFEKMLGKYFLTGLISDMSLAGNVEFGENLRVYLIGVGIDLALPGFQYTKINLYHRQNPEISGSTYQLNVTWSYPLKLGESSWSIAGFLDYRGAEGNGKNSLLFVPQILWNLGSDMKLGNQLQVGVEYQYWKNKFGNSLGITESVLQLMLKWHF